MNHPLLSVIGNERRFCGWGGTKGTAPKRPKAPATADGWPMLWSDSTKWLKLDAVAAGVKRGAIQGYGYFTSNGDQPGLTPITTIDLDNCVIDGVITGNWQRAVVETIDSITTLSPSGRGVHITCRGSSDFTAPEITAVVGQTIRGYECFSKAHHVRLGEVVLREGPLRKMTRELWDQVAQLLPGWLDEQVPAEIPAPAPTPRTPTTSTRKLTEKQIAFIAVKFNEAHDVASILTRYGYAVATKAHDGRIDVTRPGKDAREGNSGNIKNGKYFPFSSNDQLEANKPHTAFGVWCAFEYGKDEQTAAHAAAELLGIELGRKTESTEPETTETPAKKNKAAKNDKPKPTDDELAQRWIDAQGSIESMPSVAHGLGEFRHYTHGYWEEVERQVAEKELFEVIQKAKHEGVRPNSGILSSVEKLASVMVSVKDSTWDNDPDLLVCKNGTLHIPTLELRDHAPENYLTSGLPYDYDPSAECPEFLGAIRSTVPEAESFLQEFFGLCLTTETKYEVAPWLYGPPGSGKSTLIEGANAMLGSRVINLGLADIERSRFALGKLPGKTLAISTEQPTLYMQASDVLNKIISGEKVTVERKYREPIEILPKVKFLWAMNDLPRVPDANNGLFRRVKVVRFPKLAGEPDLNLKAKIRLEAAGILNWALAGLLRLMNRGHFDIPTCVTDATAEFQRENDVPATFVADCCLTGPEFRTGGQQLYDAYKAWCVANGHKAQSSTSLADDWGRLGFQRIRPAGRTVYVGIGILSPVTAAEVKSGE